MTPLVLDPTPPTTASAADGATGIPSPSTAQGAELFRNLLATTLATTPAKKPSVATGGATSPSDTVAGDDGAAQALAARLTKMLDAGASQADIVASLASQLAASAAKTLKTPGAQARGELESAFAGALAAPNSSSDDSGPVAARIVQLAQRFLQLARAAGSIATQQAGQQKLIAGNILDAQRAKDIPARTTANHPAQAAIASEASGSAHPNKNGRITSVVTADAPSATLAKSSEAAIAQSAAATAQIDATLAAASLTAPVPIDPSRAAIPAATGTAKSVATAIDGESGGASATAVGSSAGASNPRTVAPAQDGPSTPGVATLVVSTETADALSSSFVGGAPAQPSTTAVPAGERSLGSPTPAETADAGLAATIGGATIPAQARSASAKVVADRSASPDAALLAVETTAGAPLLAAASDGAKEIGNLTSAKRGGQPSPARPTSAPVTAIKTLGAAAATIVQATASAPLAGAATPASPTAVGSPLVPGPDAGAGDGRSVDLGSLAATQMGGDTGLGRTLTRAALAADARPAAIAADVSSTAPVADTAPLAASPTKIVPDPAVALFVQAFAKALKASSSSDAVQTVPRDAQASLPVSLPGEDTANSGPAFAPAVAPFAIDRAGPVPTAAAAPPVPIDHSAIADQVLRGAFMRNVGESSEMRLTLVPDSLGGVNVKLVVDAGTVTAHVVAETPEVRDALVAAQPQLTKSLAESGLKLTSFTVDLQGGGFTGFSQQNNQSQNGSRSHRSSNSADADSADDSLIEAIPSFAPSSIGKPGAGYYNYLA